MKTMDVIIIILPAILGFITSKICNLGNDAGIKIKARPPPEVFAIVWSILYILIGLSWFMYRKNINKKIVVDLLYLILIILLNGWVVMYSCKKNKKNALYILPLSILCNLILILYTLNTMSSYLLLPLFVWLNFAMLLNYSEVNI